MGRIKAQVVSFKMFNSGDSQKIFQEHLRRLREKKIEMYETRLGPRRQTKLRQATRNATRKKPFKHIPSDETKSKLCARDLI